MDPRLSDKPANIVYDAEEVWVSQCEAFLREVMGCGNVDVDGGGERRRAVLAGNSLGGFVSLATCAMLPELVCGCALLNSAGRCVHHDPSRSITFTAVRI